MPVFLLSIGTNLLHLILHKNRQFSVYFTLLFLFLSANCSRMRICRVVWLQKLISNNKKWILKKGIGLFSFSHICNSVCHVNLESVLSNWVLYNFKGLSLVSIYTEEIFTKTDLIKNILLKQWDKFVRIPFVQHNSQHLLGSFQT